MSKTIFHSLTASDETWWADYVAISPQDEIEVRIRYYYVRFNLQTAEELIDILGKYVEDHRRIRNEHWSEIDRLNQDIAARNTLEQGNGI